MDAERLMWCRLLMMEGFGSWRRLVSAGRRRRFQAVERRRRRDLG